MKHLKSILLIASTMGLSAASYEAISAPSCVTCGGYYYVAYNYSNPYGIPHYTYVSRGAFPTEESCWEAYHEDYANGDSWLPYEGSPKCIWRYDSQLEAYAEIIKDWNSGMSNDGNDNGGILADKEVISKIMDLRKSYNLSGYEAELQQLISPITDPNRDEDDDRKIKKKRSATK